jgi:hypothetical protein
MDPPPETGGEEGEADMRASVFFSRLGMKWTSWATYVYVCPCTIMLHPNDRMGFAGFYGGRIIQIRTK